MAGQVEMAELSKGRPAHAPGSVLPAGDMSSGRDRSRKAVTKEELSRRKVLLGAAGGAAALLAAGFVGYEVPGRKGGPPAPGDSAQASQATGAPANTAEAFVTEPGLHPPRVRVSSSGTTASSPAFFFLSVRTYQTSAAVQQGLMVLDRMGRTVWFKPARSQPFDFAVQSYRGSPVLTWWEGEVVDGYGEGRDYLAGGDYEVERDVGAGAGLRADLHDFWLTQRGTALLTAYARVPADLSRVGGPEKGAVLAGHVQEVDIATGKLLWDWDSLGHVGLQESFEPVPKTGPYDYFHVNSVQEAPDGEILVSARNTWALYMLDRPTGKVRWRLGGKRSDFSLGPGARFFWQHHARTLGPGFTSVFDDGASPAEERQSRGLLLDVNDRSKHVSLRRAYLYPAGFLAANQGSVQVLPDGRVVVGWGNQPYFSEFSPEGELLLDGELPFGWHSYRAFSFDWQSRPSGRPLAAALASPAGGTVVFASWNGATQIDRWVVLAGRGPGSLGAVGWQLWSGLETAITVSSAGPWFAVVAEDAARRELGRSLPVELGAPGK